MEEENRESSQDRTFFEERQTIRSEKSSGNRAPLIALVLIVLLALGVGGWFIVKDRSEPSTTPEPTPQIEISTPSPTAAPVVDRSKIQIEILNGTGTAGDAAFLGSKLKSIGYSDFELGNASSQNNTVTQVAFASTVEDEVKTEIQGILRENYQTVQTGGSVSGDTDVKIVTGLRKGATAKPTASPTPKASPTTSPKPSATPNSSPTSSPTPSATP